MNTTEYKVEKIAFEGPKDAPYKGHTVKASYLLPPHGSDALIEISNGGNVVKKFLFPAYKIWNIAAHFEDIVDGLIEESASGLLVAASDGLGGHCAIKPVE